MLDRLKSQFRKPAVRTASMVLGAVLMALLGAGGGHYFLAGKSSTPEEKPAVASENPAGELPVEVPTPHSDGGEPQLFSDTSSASPENTAHTAILPAEIPDAESRSPSSSAETESRITAIMSQSDLADEHLRSGSFAQAIRIYRQLRESAEGPVSVSLLFRLAFSAEASGNYAEALDLYQRMPRSHANRGWAGVAAMGEVRCLTALRRFDVLQSEWLRRIVLDETSFSPTIRQELLHLLGYSQWQQLAAESTGDLLNDRTMAVPDWQTEPHEVLDSLNALLQEGSPPAALPELTLLQESDHDPNAVYLRVHSNPGSVSQLLRAIIRHCRFECEVSEAAAAAADNRTMRIHASDRSLSLLLDGLTIPFGNLWLLQSSRLTVLSASEVTPDQLEQFRQLAVERLLRTALLEAPDSRQTAVSRVALGALLFRYNSPAEASHVFRVQLDSDPRSSIESATAFNLGKCLLTLRQSPEALQAFLQCIDAAGGAADLKIAGYLYAGRMQMELGNATQATSTLMRGLALSRATTLEPAAAVLLASDYLLIGNPQAANSVLMDRREMLDSRPHRDAAAFLSAAARFQAAVLPDRREREGRAVVTALSHFRPELQFGAHWSLLAADAADQLGLTAQAVDWYVQTLQRLPGEGLRQEALLKLAAIYQADERLAEAGELLKSLSSAESSHLTNLAALRAAELALEQGNPEEAVSHCRTVLARDTTPEVRRASLRVMGRSYERLQNYQAAVHCFAGTVPAPERSLHLVPDSTGAAP